MWVVVAALGVLAVVGVYTTWTARRLDRLHARVDAAAAALHAQLSKRDATATQFALALGPALAGDPSLAGDIAAAAQRATAVPGLGHDREVVENAVTRALVRAVAGVPTGAAEFFDAVTEMHDEALRATFARRFYNDTVRDALVVRDRRVVRWLRLAGHAPHPSYFEMDDEELAVSRISVAAAPTMES